MATSYRDLLDRIRANIREVDPAEADALRRSGALMVDIREQDEVEQGMVTGGVHIPRGYLELRIEEVDADRERPVVIYCAGGVRSAFAVRALQDLGYRDVVSLSGGFSGWKAAGMPWQLPKTLTADQRRRY
ncbi:MAG: rhodanese-like domain-containing protein, partial [Chloroflexota bacterium]